VTFQATVRVIGLDGRRPSSNLVSDVAGRLADLGFAVVHVGRLGVSVEGEADAFEEVLGVPPPGPGGYSLEITPRDDMLSNVIDRVEAFPPVETL
jgi:hypothetical protein